jgi:hypothetical protein
MHGEEGDELTSHHRSCLGHPQETKGWAKGDKDEMESDIGEGCAATEAATGWRWPPGSG